MPAFTSDKPLVPGGFCPACVVVSVRCDLGPRVVVDSERSPSERFWSRAELLITDRTGQTARTKAVGAAQGTPRRSGRSSLARADSLPSAARSRCHGDIRAADARHNGG